MNLKSESETWIWKSESESWIWNLNLKSQSEIWIWNLNPKDEPEIWNWNLNLVLHLKSESEICIWNVNLKSESESWIWSLLCDKTSVWCRVVFVLSPQSDDRPSCLKWVAILDGNTPLLLLLLINSYVQSETQYGSQTYHTMSTYDWQL